MKICSECNYSNKDDRNFCIKCGTFLSKDLIKDQSLAKLPEFKLMRIMENLKQTPHNRIVWDSVIDKYVEDVEKYSALYEIDDIKNNYNSSIGQKMLDFLDTCQKNEFQIAFVGTIKTGKSTLINALLGKNYASMSVTPETAALTKFRSSPKDYIRIKFYDKDEWNDLWASMSSGADKFMDEYRALRAESCKNEYIGHEEICKYISNDAIENELKPWTSSQFPQHYFVKEVEVGISNLPVGFPSQVVFVDTPGLSDPVAYRSEITKKYIRKANAVFVCVEAQKLQQTELETLYTVFSVSHHDKKKVHVIATHWDTLNNPEVDWKQQVKYMHDQLVSDACFPDENTAKSNITYSAAYLYNICRDFSNYDEVQKKERASLILPFMMKYLAELTGKDFFNPMNPLDINDGILSFIMEKSNIEVINQIIRDRLVNNYKSIFMKDIKAAYLDIQYDLKRAVRESTNIQKDLLATARAGIAEQRRKLEENKKACDDIRDCQNKLRNYIEVADKQTNASLNKILESLNQPPKPEYKDAGKKIYEGAAGTMSKIKRVIFG